MENSHVTIALTTVLISVCAITSCSRSPNKPRLVGTWELVIAKDSKDFSTAITEGIKNADQTESETASVEADVDANVVRFGSDGRFEDEATFAGLAIASQGTWTVLSSSPENLIVEVKIDERRVGSAAPQPSASIFRWKITFDGPDAMDAVIEQEDGEAGTWRLQRQAKL